MSLTELRHVVLLFSNPVWAGSATIPQSLVRNITSLSGSLGREETIDKNLTTLSTTNAETLNGIIQGLLYVPEISSSDPCSEEQYEEGVGLPRNVTRKSDLPPTNYKLIAIAPFFKKECTKAYLKATRFHTVRAFIFYKTNNFTLKPPEADNPTWDLDDDGVWLEENPFPIFAIPGLDGQNLVNRLSKYSGQIDQAPHGQQIIDTFGPNPRDYIRIWAELTLKDSESLPALWTFFVIVLGSLVVLIAFISIFLHMVQRRRRHELAQRVKAGYLNLEKAGIARVQVPESTYKKFPTYTFQRRDTVGSEPPTPGGTSVAGSRSAGTTRHINRNIQSVISLALRTETSSPTVDDARLRAEKLNAQFMCHLCEEEFISNISIIRQLKCQHIFHPECIDEYLHNNSSLCPVCRECMLPDNYVPKITNGMVRRERAARRFQGTVNLDLEKEDTSRLRLFAPLFNRTRDPSPAEVAMSPVLRTSRIEEEPTPGEVPLPPSSSPLPAPAPAPTSESPAPATSSTHPRPPDLAVTAGPSDQSKEAAATPTGQKKHEKRVDKRRRKKKGQPNYTLAPTPGKMEKSGSGDTIPLDHQIDGRKSPTPETKARMKELAEENTPLSDRRAIWRKAVSKVFPGIV